MFARGPSIPMWFALFASFLLHAGVAYAFLVAPPAINSHGALADAMDDPPVTEPEQLLGDEDSDAATMTWIGYEEYEQQIARHSTVEQAEFVRGSNASPAPAMQADAQQSAEQARQMVKGAASRALQPIDDMKEAARETAQAVKDVLKSFKSKPDDQADVALADQRETARQLAKVGEGAPGQSASKQTPAKTGGLATQTPQQAAATGANPAKSGNSPDRESVATSTIKASELRAGKPLTAQGLKITTRRPEFSMLTRATISPRNPVVEITFDHTGRVVDAKIVRTSGSPDSIDRPIVDAMYFWKAQGKKLKELAQRQPPGTVTFRFQILLSG